MLVGRVGGIVGALVVIATTAGSLALDTSAAPVLPPIASRASSALVGLDDQSPATFTETTGSGRTAKDVKRWDAFKRALTIVAARRLVKWNLYAQSCFATSACPEDMWVRNVESEGLAPEIVLQGS